MYHTRTCYTYTYAYTRDMVQVKHYTLVNITLNVLNHFCFSLFFCCFYNSKPYTLSERCLYTNDYIHLRCYHGAVGIVLACLCFKPNNYMCTIVGKVYLPPFFIPLLQ